MTQKCNYCKLEKPVKTYNHCNKPKAPKLECVCCDYVKKKPIKSSDKSQKLDCFCCDHVKEKPFKSADKSQKLDCFCCDYVKEKPIKSVNKTQKICDCCNETENKPQKLDCFCCNEDDNKIPELDCFCCDYKEKPKSQNKIQKLFCSLNPPNVSGVWKNPFCFLEQNGLDADISLCDVAGSSTIINIKQQGVFVIFRAKPSIVRPYSKDRIGVWRPIYQDGDIVNWELYVTDYDDNQISILQVAKTDNGRATILHISTSESGFDLNNPLQKPLVATGFLYRD